MVYAQVYSSTGVTIGSEFKVNTFTASNQFHATVVGLEDGGFVVCWESNTQDGSGLGVYGQRYDANGNVYIIPEFSPFHQLAVRLSAVVVFSSLKHQATSHCRSFLWSFLLLFAACCAGVSLRFL